MSSEVWMLTIFSPAATRILRFFNIMKIGDIEPSFRLTSLIVGQSTCFSLAHMHLPVATRKEGVVHFYPPNRLEAQERVAVRKRLTIKLESSCGVR